MYTAVSLSSFSADKIDVMRDILAYMVVLAIIIAVAYDGTVKHYHKFLVMVPSFWMAYDM